MQITSLEEISKFISDFEDCSLPKSKWTHKAHFVVGTWYVFHHGKEKALEIIRENIKKYNVSKGVMNTDTDGYHETITIFYLWAIDRFLSIKPKELTVNLFNELLNSEITDKDYPYKFYSKDLLFSVKARYEWVEPDLGTLVNANQEQ